MFEGCKYNWVRRLLEGSGNTVWRWAYGVVRLFRRHGLRTTPHAVRHTVLLRTLNAANQSDELATNMVDLFVEVSEGVRCKNVQVTGKNQIVLKLLRGLQRHSQVSDELGALTARAFSDV
jgi:hypothetical protein